MQTLWGPDEGKSEKSAPEQVMQKVWRGSKLAVRKEKWRGGHKYNCQTCFHNAVGGCTDAEDGKVCGYWYSPESEAKGIEYKEKTVGRTTVLEDPQYSYWDHHGTKFRRYHRKRPK